MKTSFSLTLLLAAIVAAKAGQAIITSGPQDLTINAGSTADFIVTASGATSYQWVFQGTNITGATNNELNFSEVSTNQAGAYSVIVVSGSGGTNLTNSANLTVLQGTIVNFQISGFASGPSNVVVELFDHDKPATVQNFLHYIVSSYQVISGVAVFTNAFVPGAYTNTYSSGAYSNMFFDRLIPGFVLQGGDWDAGNRTTNTLWAGSIADIYGGLYFQPPFPQALASEFYVGPKVSNQQGTIAMALPAGNVNGATSAFFFNLVDNPFLDVYTNGGGPYTVFGRVLSGSEVLAYFNNTNAFFKPSFTKMPTRNIFTNGIFDYALLGYEELTDLPVNYHGTNYPANSNLFFVDFSFPAANAQPVIDTTPPSTAITFPPADAVLTNGISLTVRGTAQDDVGLARVYCSLIALNGAYGGGAGGENAVGTTNWSAAFGVIQPGVYNLVLTSQDGAGNLSSEIQQQMIITAILTNGDGVVAATNVINRTYTANAIGANLRVNTNYAFGAQPAPGWFFVNWRYGTNTSFTPNLTLKFGTNMVLTANFVSNSVANGMAFSYPPVGGNTTNGTFSIAGVVNNSLLTPPVTITCRLFSQTNQQLVGSVRQLKATNTWAFPVTNLALGEYYAVVTAQDALGQGTVITNDFSAGLRMTVLTNGGNGRGTVSPSYNGQFLVQGQHYTMTAVPAGGSLFENWSIGVTNSNNISYTNSRVAGFIMSPGLVFTAAFVSNDFPGSVASPLAITNPASGAKLTVQTLSLSGTINPAIANPVVSYQLFYGSNSVAAPSATNVVITAAAAPARSTWSAGLTNLPPGYYTVVATLTDVNGRSTLVSESFQILAQVLLQVNPIGSGSILSNWTTGHYVSAGLPHAVAARTNGGFVFAYWSNSLSGGLYGNNPLTFTPTTNMTLTAFFDTNYFYNIAGTYVGLFTNGFISPTNSGYCSLIVTSNGGINLSLKFPALTLTSVGQFPLYDPAGYTTAGFYWKGLDGKFITNIVNLDLTGGSYSLVGEVTNAEFSSSLVAFRAAPKLTAGIPVLHGTNIFSIPGDHSAANNLPGGDGYATFTLGTNGVVNLIGYLGDNYFFSQSTLLSTNFYGTNAIWPFYASLYGGKGIAIGWETNTTPTNFEGAVAWSKPARASAYETNAFLVLTNSFSSAWLPPVAGTHYQIIFGGASFTNALTNTLSVSAKRQFINDSGLPNTNKLTLTLTTNGPTTGALSGSFSYPTGKIVHGVHGAFISPSVGGSGYFLDTNSQTGYFEIRQIVP